MARTTKQGNHNKKKKGKRSCPVAAAGEVQEQPKRNKEEVVLGCDDGKEEDASSLEDSSGNDNDSSVSSSNSSTLPTKSVISSSAPRLSSATISVSSTGKHSWVSAVTMDSSVPHPIVQHQKTHARQMTSFIKVNVFSKLKFFLPKYGEGICRAALRADKDPVLLPENISQDEFVEHWKLKVGSCIASLRHACETNSLRNYKKGMSDSESSLCCQQLSSLNDLFALQQKVSPPCPIIFHQLFLFPQRL
jgi:hypothetical protein